MRLAAGGRPAAGAVWAYCDPEGRIVVHRCLGRRGAAFVFRGDGRSIPDPAVPADVLIGAVVAVDNGTTIRKLGLADRLWRGWPRSVGFRARTVASSARRRGG